MPSVKVRENEPFEFALRRFKRTCEKAGILAETRKREFYEKPTQERKRKAAAAVKRTLRRVMRDVTKRQRMYCSASGARVPEPIASCTLRSRRCPRTAGFLRFAFFEFQHPRISHEPQAATDG